MLDGWARRRIDPALDAIAARLARSGVGANAVTIASFGIGAAAAAAISAGWFATGLVLILTSRLGDGLDGAIARQGRPTDLGGYLDIVLDFAFYGLVPLGFAVADPTHNAIPAAILLVAFYANGGSFLAFAAVAAKRGLESSARGTKSIFFTTGLAEGTETIAAFVLACLFPRWFPQIALVFSAMTVWTTVSRMVHAWQLFGTEAGR